MNNTSMTALISAFARAYHCENSNIKIFNDNVSRKLFSTDEWNLIIDKFTSGIKYFNPKFYGTKEESIKWIMNNQIAPSILGRSAFCEESLLNAINFGTKQYLIFASGYDTYAYRYNNINVFEIDKESVIEDKKRRVASANLNANNLTYVTCDLSNDKWYEVLTNKGYDKAKISFSSLLGITYYLTKDELENFIKILSKNICDGSTIVFDYPTFDGSKECIINEELAKGASEEMKSKYTFKEIERMLEKNGILVYEHLNNVAMTEKYFSNYNTINPNDRIVAPKGVEYILAVKKGII